MSGGPMPHVNAAWRLDWLCREASHEVVVVVCHHFIDDLHVEPHVHHVSVGEHVVLPLDLE